MKKIIKVNIIYSNNGLSLKEILLKIVKANLGIGTTKGGDSN